MTGMPAARAALAARSAAATTEASPIRSTMPCWKSISSRTGRESEMGKGPRKSRCIGMVSQNLSDQTDQFDADQRSGVKTAGPDHRLLARPREVDPRVGPLPHVVALDQRPRLLVDHRRAHLGHVPGHEVVDQL